MGSGRIIAIIVLLAGIVFNEAAFRFFTSEPPYDSFLRLMTIPLDLFLLVFVITFFRENAAFAERLRHLLNKHARTVLLFIGLFGAYCLIVAAEIGARIYFRYGYKAPYTEHIYWEPRAADRDPVLGTKLPADTVIGHAYVINDSLIYKQYYRTDTFGRRINPPSLPDSAYSEFVMVTGASFAFGYGLPDNRTLSFYLDSITGKRAYNYAVYGHGTQQTLALLQSRDLHSEMNEKNGVLIHLFTDYHLARLVGSFRMIKLWAAHFPYYYLDGDELKRNGSFWSGRHLLSRFYRALGPSALIDLLQIDLPLRFRQKHFELFGAVLREAKKEFLKQYPEGRFIVVIGPSSEFAPQAKAILEANYVEVLDLSDLLDKDRKRYKIHWTEAHPNGNYDREVAEEIGRYLNKP